MVEVYMSYEDPDPPHKDILNLKAMRSAFDIILGSNAIAHRFYSGRIDKNVIGDSVFILILNNNLRL